MCFNLFYRYFLITKTVFIGTKNCLHSTFQAKSGVGKTITTINLSIGLNNEGHKVLIIDFDPQGDMTICLGLTPPLKTII